MLPRGSPTGSVGDASGAFDAELHRRYVAYRRRQAARLLEMIPRDAIRPLYRKARTEDAGSGDGPVRDDPLASLVAYCEALLPLPPFEVWRGDLESHPDAHFQDVEESLDGPTVDAPSTMEARSFEYGRFSWTANLRAFRDNGLWRAHIAFEERSSGRAYATAPIFCEEDARELRDRFLSFDTSALQAFLRSSLP